MLSKINLQKTTKMNPNNNHNQDELDNRSQQLDPENDAYWQSRGEDERPEDWQDLLDDD